MDAVAPDDRALVDDDEPQQNDVPDWMRNPGPQSAQAQDNVPDWMRNPGPAQSPDDNVPDWMRNPTPAPPPPDQSDWTQSGPAAAARGAVREALPAAGGVAGAVQGAAIGAGLGSVVPGAGTFIGGLAGAAIGGFAGATVVHSAQDALIKELGWDQGTSPFDPYSTTQQQKDIAAHPNWTKAGEIAAAIPSLTVAPEATLLERGLAGAGMAGFSAGQQYLETGKVDPLEVGLSAGLGVAAPRPRFGPAFARTSPGQPSEAAAGELAGRPNVPLTDDAAAEKAGVDTNAKPVQTLGTAAEAPQPFEMPWTKIGGPEAEPHESPMLATKADGPETQYIKGAPAKGEQASGVVVNDNNGIAPDVAQVLDEVPWKIGAQEGQAAPQAPVTEPVTPPQPQPTQDVGALLRSRVAQPEPQQPKPPPDPKALATALDTFGKLGYNKVVQKILTAPPEQRAQLAADALTAFNNKGGVAQPGQTIRIPSKRPTLEGSQITARDKGDAARKQQPMNAVKQTFAELGPGKSEVTPDNAHKVARQALARATQLNNGNNPLGTKAQGGYTPKSAPPEYRWLQAAQRVARVNTPKAVEEFLAAHALGGETGNNVEGELARRGARPAVEALAAPETEPDYGERTVFDMTEPEKTRTGKPALGQLPGVRQQNALRSWLNGLTDEDYSRLQSTHGEPLRVEVENSTSPGELLSTLKQTLAQAKGGRPTGRITYPEEEGIPKPVEGDELARLIKEQSADAMQDQIKITPPDTTKGKVLAAKYGDETKKLLPMRREDMPANLEKATANLQKAMGAEETPEDDLAAKLKARTVPEAAGGGAGGKPPGGGTTTGGTTPPTGNEPVPKLTKDAVRNWIARNPFGRGAASILSVRGTYSDQAEASAATIRKNAAQRQQQKDILAAKLEPLRPIVNNLPDDEKLDFQMAMQGDRDMKKFPQLQPLADLLKEHFENVKQRIADHGLLDIDDFLENYFPQLWKDPDAAKTFMRDFAIKQGSSGPLKERKIPSISQGLAAGLKPAYTDPIEAAINYTDRVERYIELNKNLREGKADGFVHDTMRPGDVPLKGRMLNGRTLFAPIDWAHNFNNFYDAGIFHQTEEGGRIYDTMRRGSNFVTALELAGPMFHTMTMAMESVIGKVATGLYQGAHGDFAKALERVGTAAGAPITYAKAAGKYKYEWLHPGSSDPETQELVNLFRDAGGRMIGFTHDPTYEFAGSPMSNFITSFRRGALKMEGRQTAQAIQQAYAKSPVQGTKVLAGQLFHTLGRVMQTISAPLFEHYIPAVKTGMAMEQISDFLRAFPDATREQKLAVARRVIDSTDNRLGEMIQDNIFLNKTLKESAQLGMRSYSWNLGTVGEIGGGAMKLMTQPHKIGKLLDIGSAEYDPRVAYVLALPIVVGITSAIYQYMKTGKPPESIADLVAGRTGGTLKSGYPERAIFPGYEKDVLGWFNSPTKEAYNKIATAPRLIWETLSNKDWRDDPIANKNAPVMTQLEQYFQHVADSMGPIYLKQAAQPATPGSRITAAERGLSLRPAPSFVSGPNRPAEKAIAREWKIKQAHDRRSPQVSLFPQFAPK